MKARHPDWHPWRRRGRALMSTGGLRILAAAAGGAASYAGFAPSTAWWAPLIGFALLAIAVHGRGWKSSAGLGLVFGVAMYFPLLSWTNIYVGNVPWAALAGAESVLVMPAAALMGPASRRLPAWPVWAAAAWITGETLRGAFPFGGFPWGNIAFTQPDGPLLPIAAVLGGAGLSFAAVLCGMGLGDVVRRGWRRWRDGAGNREAPRGMVVAAGLVVIPLLGGLASTPAVQSGDGAESAPIGMVQGNVPRAGLEFNAQRRAVLDMHAQETHRLAKAVADGTVPQPRLVIWPENSSDIDPYRNDDAAAVISKAAAEMGVPILIGAVVQAGELGQHDGSKQGIGRVYNEGIVWDPDTGPGATYAKRHPVPFAEYVPYRDFFRFFSSKVDLVTADFLPGHRPGNFVINGVPVGDVICFEIVEDGLVRDVVHGGARVIVVQTNNATFGYTDETYQQQAMSRVRAVEYGREVLIVSTSGVSTVIGPDGEVASEIPLFTPGFLVPEVPLISATTPGTVLGAPVRWVVSAAAPLALLIMLVWRLSVARTRRSNRDQSTTTEEEVPSADA